MEIERWLKGGHYSHVTKRGRKPKRYVVLASAERIPFDPISLLISEVLHNLRSGLDNVAYRLAENFTTPLPSDIAEDSEFPIFGDKNRKGVSGSGPGLFRDSGLKKIRGVDPAAQAIIESLQPYQRGNGYVSDPLWKLHELSRIDKHRLLHPVACDFSGVALTPDRSFNARLTPGKIRVRGGPIERNTEVISYNAEPIDPRAEMHVDFEPAVGIAFPDGSVAAREKVIDALTEIHNYIGNTVLPPLSKYLA